MTIDAIKDYIEEKIKCKFDYGLKTKEDIINLRRLINNYLIGFLDGLMMANIITKEQKKELYKEFEL